MSRQALERGCLLVKQVESWLLPTWRGIVPLNGLSPNTDRKIQSCAQKSHSITKAVGKTLLQRVFHLIWLFFFLWEGDFSRVFDPGGTSCCFPGISTMHSAEEDNMLESTRFFLYSVFVVMFFNVVYKKDTIRKNLNEQTNELLGPGAHHPLLLMQPC